MTMTESTPTVDEIPPSADEIIEKYRPHAADAVKKACYAVGKNGKLAVEPIVNQAREMLYRLGIFPEDVLDTDVWWDTVTEYLTRQAEEAIAMVDGAPLVWRVDPHADQNRRKRLQARLGAESADTPLDRAIGRAERERERAIGPQPQISAEAGAEILAICSHEALLGRPVLVAEWDETSDDGEWEALLTDAQELGYMRIVRVRDVTPRPKGMPLDGWIIVVEREQLPVGLWRAADEIASVAKRKQAVLDPAWLLQRYVEDGAPMRLIAEECGKSESTVRKHLLNNSIELRRPGRPKTIEGTATDLAVENH